MKQRIFVLRESGRSWRTKIDNFLLFLASKMDTGLRQIYKQEQRVRTATHRLITAETALRKAENGRQEVLHTLTWCDRKVANKQQAVAGANTLVEAEQLILQRLQEQRQQLLAVAQPQPPQPS